MADNSVYRPGEFEDIKSTSRVNTAKNAAKTVKRAAENYGNGAFKNMAGIIKMIAFMVSTFFFLLFSAASVVLYRMDDYFLVIAIAIFIFGIIFSLITLFLIYGLGHVIAQNNEILRRL